MTPNLEPVNFQEVQKRAPENWRAGNEYDVEQFETGSGTYRVVKGEESYLVRLVRRENAWYGWCECDDFDGLETCPHVCSAAIKVESIEGIGGD